MGSEPTQLVLSLFPGLDLLGRAFGELGFSVVAGPDVIFGGDVRGWHCPPGRFDGVIGGPPCQCFSSLRHIVKRNGHEPRFGNLIPEFERLCAEAEPAWWLVAGKCHAVGNGVPMAMGRALARAVIEYCTAETCEPDRTAESGEARAPPNPAGRTPEQETTEETENK